MCKHTTGAQIMKALWGSEVFVFWVRSSTALFWRELRWRIGLQLMDLRTARGNQK